MVVKIEDKELRAKEGKRGRAGWIPKSEDENSSSKNSRSIRATLDCMNDGGNEGLVASQERLEEAAAAIKATTTAIKNKSKFMVPDEIKEMAAAAAKCRDPVRRKMLRKSARKPRRELDASRGALPRGTVVERFVVTNPWVTGPAKIEMSGRKRSANKCYDDTVETPDVQAERVGVQRRRGNSLIALQSRRMRITVAGLARAVKNEEQGQRPGRLPGGGGAAVLANEDCVRGGALVREAVQGRMLGPRSVENSPPRTTQEARRQVRKKGCVGSARLHS